MAIIIKREPPEVLLIDLKNIYNSDDEEKVKTWIIWKEDTQIKDGILLALSLNDQASIYIKTKELKFIM